MRGPLTALAVLFASLFSFVCVCRAADEAPEQCASVADADVWFLTTGGLWERGESYGQYRALVLRKGVEHGTDTVQVQITKVLDATDSRTVVQCVNLESPGLKGFVKDVGIVSIDKKRAAVHLDIEMKAMDGIVLREVHIVSADGKARKISDARYIDLYE